ncbi:MAG: formylmethanofuran dehydrogenase subunit E [Desulfuromonadales bacterium]|nr:formylmethanofuran dehydrogenase subunit E [Desulfuromonadales bacterium]
MQITNVHEVLQRCIDYHGHYCAGQSLGVRIAKKGLELVAAEDQKDLIVFVENDRCIADAVLMATGTRLGRRSLKFVDYGKMAATFVNLKTDTAYRVVLKPVDHDKAPRDDGQEEVKERVLTLEDDELLSWKKVKVRLRKEELPGKPERIVNCVQCGEKVFDAKDLDGNGTVAGPFCVSCVRGAYYEASI